MTQAAAVGSHILADLHGIPREMLRDSGALESLMRTAAIAAGCTVLGSHFHSFGDEDGVTGVVLLGESHLSIHTWPEFEFAAADIFMCGAADTRKALEVLLAGLRPQQQTIKTEPRGRPID